MSETTTAPVVPVNADGAVNALRYDEKTRTTWADYVKENNVTREVIAAHAAALAGLAWPKDKPVQKTDGKRTRYGNAVQAAGAGMRRALGPVENTATTDYLLKVVKAVESALDHDVTADQIAAAVKSHLS